MSIESLKTYFGDRVIVEELPLPEKIGSFFVPEAHRDNKDRKSAWKARVVAFGLDSKASDPNGWGLKTGDIVLVDPVFKDIDPFFENGKKYLRVPDEHIVAKVEDEAGAIA